MSPTTKNAGGDRAGGLRGELTPRRITALAAAVIALVFVFENTKEVEIRLLIPEVTMPLWLALLAVGVVGVLCGVLLVRRRG
ncbi:DUF1049 domain-containing protein [Streptomyces sp. P1-3]|uniref:DUF1049 domain-containing protein n=1 Tax=Streptomyces sp. P1-3 TaxID=3421658 RepID=UPI003D36B290